MDYPEFRWGEFRGFPQACYIAEFPLRNCHVSNPTMQKRKNVIFPERRNSLLTILTQTFSAQTHPQISHNESKTPCPPPPQLHSRISEMSYESTKHLEHSKPGPANSPLNLKRIPKASQKHPKRIPKLELFKGSQSIPNAYCNEY